MKHSNYSKIIDVFHSRIFLLFETISLIFLPVVILWFKPEILHFRIQLFIISFIYILYLFIVEKFTFSQFGITTINFNPAVKSILPTTAIIFAILITSIFFKYDSRFLFIEAMAHEVTGDGTGIVLAFSIFFSAAIQEIIFRGFYITRLELVSKNKFFLVFMSALVFAIVHTPFKNNFFTVATFVTGVWYALNFLKYRNIFAIILSHTILLGGLFFTIIF